MADRYTRFTCLFFTAGLDLLLDDRNPKKTQGFLTAKGDIPLDDQMRLRYLTFAHLLLPRFAAMFDIPAENHTHLMVLAQDTGGGRFFYDGTRGRTLSAETSTPDAFQGRELTPPAGYIRLAFKGSLIFPSLLLEGNLQERISRLLGYNSEEARQTLRAAFLSFPRLGDGLPATCRQLKHIQEEEIAILFPQVTVTDAAFHWTIGNVGFLQPYCGHSYHAQVEDPKAAA